MICRDPGRGDTARARIAEIATGAAPRLRLLDRFRGLGAAMNRAAGASKTMAVVGEYREREARLASAPRDDDQAATADRDACARCARGEEDVRGCVDYAAVH